MRETLRSVGAFTALLGPTAASTSMREPRPLPPASDGGLRFAVVVEVVVAARETVLLEWELEQPDAALEPSWLTARVGFPACS